MAIAAQGGTSANNSGSVSSLALPSYPTTTGRTLVLVVALGATGSSVSSISSSAGSYSWTLQSSQNGTGVRSEIWTSPVTTGAATVFTVNITGGATSVAAALEEYSGPTAIGNTGTGSGSSAALRASAALQDQNNFVVAGLAFACQSGDTLAVSLGTSQQSSIPAATAVGVALYDNTSLLCCTLADQADISASRNWAATAVELRSGSAATSALSYAASTAAALQTGHANFNYQKFDEPLFAQQQNYPPTPGANNSGFVE